VNRREFITLLGGAAATWPVVAQAQQAMPVIGFLASRSLGDSVDVVAAFHKGLGEAGFVEGKNIVVHYRWAEGQYSRLPEMAAELVQRQVAAIATFGPPAAYAAKAKALTIPIVFSSGADPVSSGLVASINRPGGNATGTHMFLQGLESKKLGLLREIAPNASTVAILLNPTHPDAATQMKDVNEAARALSQKVEIVHASTENGIDVAFATAVQRQAGALLVGADPFFNSRRDQVVGLAARYALPAIYELREFAVAGGLVSYGISLADSYRQVGLYIGRILKGEKPADLPVVQSSRFEFVINLKTAKALGLSVPGALSARADEVIE
jgi:putative ABC transport system substrate-binding protein